MDNLQKRIFLDREGDQWFARNREAIGEEKVNDSNLFYRKFLKNGARVLEIGCADGHNLQQLRKCVECTCYGIDPSQMAIQNGQLLYPDICLTVGTADKLEFEDEYFDFVLFGFCLYLVDRKFLTKVVAEADRVLKNNGFIGITDFDSKLPRQRRYKHVEGMYSYKMDYAALFLAFPHYSMADKICFSHAGTTFTSEQNERVASTVLYKRLDDAYIKENE